MSTYFTNTHEIIAQHIAEAVPIRHGMMGKLLPLLRPGSPGGSSATTSHALRPPLGAVRTVADTLFNYVLEAAR